MCLFAEMGFSTVFLLAVLMTTIAFLLLRSRRYTRRQDRSLSPIVHTERPKTRREGRHLDAPHEVLQWEVQMQELARDLSGQLDSKMGALEHLIREADRAAARLEAALEATRRASDNPPAAAEAIGEAPGSKQEPEPSPRPPVSQAEALTSRGAADHRSTPGGREDEPGPERPPAERRYEEIYVLADYGFDAAEIARRVGTPVGEVELILGLRAKRG